MGPSRTRWPMMLAVAMASMAAAAIDGPRALAACGVAARRRGGLAVRGGATKSGGAVSKKKGGKAKQLDPTGTPVAMRLLRPVSAACDKYDAAVEANPMVGLVGQMALTFGSMRLINRALDKAEKAKATVIARLLYVGFLVLHQGLLSYIESLIVAADDETPLKLPGNPMLAALAKKQVDGGADGGVAGALVDKLTAKETTVKDYDLDMVKKGRNSQLGSLVVMCFLHIKKGMLQPLVAQAVMGAASLIKEPLVQVHLLGRDLERPFVPPQPAWLKAMQAQQEEAAKAAAEAAAEAEGDDDEEDAAVDEDEEDTEEEEDEEDGDIDDDDDGEDDFDEEEEA